MPAYLTPGVYIEEVSSGSRPIEAVATSVTAFIGVTGERGTQAAVQSVRSWRDYQGHYGDIRLLDDVMGLSVKGFFENGGRHAYICNPEIVEDNGAAYSEIITTLLDLASDASVIIMPGTHWGDHNHGTEKIKAVLDYCEVTKRCMVIVDLPDNRLTTRADVQTLGLPCSSYGVVYYPWIEVAAPKPRIRGQGALPMTRISPSGHVAGVLARTDASRGVWKAPAGINVPLRGKFRLGFDIEDGDQDELNPLGINCLRKMPRTGPVIWGSRTLATNADPEWRYVPVRRTAMMIEQSIYNGIQWAVFEPNDHRLWTSLQASIASFMNGLFRAGAFQGAKASDAYFVRCSLGDTMTQAEIDAGQVIMIVGFAPVKPAEFVIVRIQQKVNQQ